MLSVLAVKSDSSLKRFELFTNLTSLLRHIKNGNDPTEYWLFALEIEPCRLFATDDPEITETFKAIFPADGEAELMIQAVRIVIDDAESGDVSRAVWVNHDLVTLYRECVDAMLIQQGVKPIHDPSRHTCSWAGHKLMVRTR